MVDPAQVIAQAVQDGAFPGAQFAFEQGSNRTLACAGTLSYSGFEPVSSDTVYDLASLTKPLVTAVLTFRWLEQGELRLEDELTRFLPVGPKVQLLHLLEHSSGLPAHRRFDQILGAEAGRDAIVEHVARTSLEAEPGTHAVYSDLGFILLAAALETIGGPIDQQWAQLMVPGLSYSVPTHQGVAPTEHDLVGVVHDENARAMGGVAGHAGLFGTAKAVQDFARDLVEAYHGRQQRWLSSASVRRMWTASSVAGSTRTPGWDRPSRPSSAGEHWPTSSVGHLGFTGTSLWIEPERGLIATLISNRVCPTRDNNQIRVVRPQFHDAVWKALVG